MRVVCCLLRIIAEHTFEYTLITMADIPTVRKLNDLLQNLLKPSEKILGTEMSRLTAPGDNYVSFILRIVVRIKNTEAAVERTIDTVAKLVPETELVEGLFDAAQTGGAEFHFYNSIVPILDTFLKSNGFPEGADFTVPFYCGRLNLTGEEKADKDSVILLKNLRPEGFRVAASKFEGLDQESTKVVLASLAKFHAGGIGIKQQHYDVFEAKLRTHFYTFFPKHLNEFGLTNLIHVLETSNEFTKEEIEKARAAYTKDIRYNKEHISDLWGTMVHYDTWTNNILIKYSESRPILAKLIDFQFYDYGTPLNDVMFFLFSSVQQPVLEQQLDKLLDYYYETLLTNLKRVGVSIGNYKRESFDEEVKLAVTNAEYFHFLWMSHPLMEESFGDVGALNDQHPNTVFEWSKEHVYKAWDGSPDQPRTWKLITGRWDLSFRPSSAPKFLARTGTLMLYKKLSRTTPEEAFAPKVKK